MDASILATTLQEIGGPVGHYEYSGKTITVPNSTSRLPRCRTRTSSASGRSCM
ncbi:MAG: hypothetical protein U5L11_16885 [Arhodomonas sp.]|nr:hypothetical protein [Arhodomonas sp.]